MISKLGITEGPWEIGESLSGRIGVKAGSDMICTVAPEWVSDKHSGNLKLISVAPEMLLVIIAMLKAAEEGNAFKGAEVLDLMGKVLDKATGKTYTEIMEVLK